MTNEPIKTTKLSRTVRFRNGAEENMSFVALVYSYLQQLLDKNNAGAVYELIELCRDPDLLFLSESSANILEDLKLIQRIDAETWHVNDSICNVVLSCVRGEGTNMVIDSPLADEPTKSGVIPG